MSSGFLKRLLLALLGILLVAIAAFAVLLHNAFQATEDGARINSDTLVRMTVNLRGSSPSRWSYIFRTMIIRISGRSWSKACRESSGTGQAMTLHGSGMIWPMSRRTVM